ncbi:MAG TPA: EutN/CcmL family microcompartment protein [Pseudomonadota bacterium]|nr:EutN/CcmL family microcompartment protein [Pseudomonadota bacterium]
MFVGKVIGTVWSTVKWPQVQGLKLMLVRPYHLADLADLTDLTEGPGAAAQKAPPVATGAASPSPRGGPDCEAVVCVDLLDAGVGDDVVVAFGHAARVAAQSADANPEGHHGTSPAQSSSRRNPKESQAGGPAALPGQGYGRAEASAIVPIDAAIVAIVDRIAVARPST